MPGNKKDIYLPILLKITGKNILVIGAGNACREKLNSLRQLGTRITVVAPELHPDFLDQDWIEIRKRKFTAEDLEGMDIVYSGVNNPDLETEIFRECRKRCILVNFVDKVEYSDFISPSLLKRKNFSIFISTYGKGPGATKKIRQTIEEKINLEELDKTTGDYIKNRRKNNSGFEEENPSDI